MRDSVRVNIDDSMVEVILTMDYGRLVREIEHVVRQGYSLD